MLRVRKPARRPRARVDVAVAPESEEHPVLALQRTIGNRAVQRLIQRDFVRDLGPTNAADWTSKRAESVSVIALYEEIAKLAKAKDKLRDVKATEGKVNQAIRNNEGEKDIKPGLNFVAKLAGQAGGETGFVAADGVFFGPHLPVTLEGGLPSVAVILGPKAFDRGKDHAFAVLRHELEHARHYEMMIDKVAEWRREAAKGGTKLSADQSRARFTQWVTKSKSMDKVHKALLLEESAAGDHPNTELLAYVEGVISVFHLGPQVPDIKLMLTGDFPAAIHQLWKAGEKGNGAADVVRKAALARLKDYRDNFLDAKQRAAFRDWVKFMIDLGTQTPPKEQSPEAAARRLAHARLKEKAVLDFLKSL